MWRELCHIRRERGARDVLNYCLMILVKPQSDSTMIAQAFEGKNTLARHRFGKNFRPSRSVLKIINTFSPLPVDADFILLVSLSKRATQGSNCADARVFSGLARVRLFLCAFIQQISLFFVEDADSGPMGGPARNIVLETTLCLIYATLQEYVRDTVIPYASIN